VADAVVVGAAEAGWTCDPCAVSDGGEGFADVIARSGGAGAGAWVEDRVTGPLGDPVTARWWFAGDASGGQAVMECAAASGLPLAGGADGNDPLAATSRGTGELLVAAARVGARRVLLGVGGSAMTDGGRGALDAIESAGGLPGVEVVVACDVDVGFVDAATRFAPQKGAGPSQVAILRDRLVALAGTYRERYGVDVESLPGAGAAGGLAGGLAAMGARLVPGFDVVAAAVGVRARMEGKDIVITGEGGLDDTSWSGKVVGGIVGLSAEAGVPVLVVAGSVAQGPGTARAVRRAGTSVQVVSLSSRFGRDRAMRDPTGCVTEVVASVLSDRP